MAKPQRRIDWQSMTSSPYKAASAAVIASFAESGGRLLPCPNALVDVVDFQIAGAKGRQPDQALGDHTRLQPASRASEMAVRHRA